MGHAPGQMSNRFQALLLPEAVLVSLSLSQVARKVGEMGDVSRGVTMADDHLGRRDLAAIAGNPRRIARPNTFLASGRQRLVHDLLAAPGREQIEHSHPAVVVWYAVQPAARRVDVEELPCLVLDGDKMRCCGNDLAIQALAINRRTPRPAEEHNLVEQCQSRREQ